ncbi:STAS domain-containing protein [Lentzea albida]|uniref:Anti-sigma factor antagonist n=1 Tax=Lentzea albida TaxID=65499 RepID=A0A1H9MT76_9PSEU|nr:STAS domain-containing protein [Lentzea albida]SER26882.1 anti-anti-sigma factor [Lentzea albida]
MPNTFLGPLHVQREVHGLAVVVRAAGEVDEFTVLPLRMELQTALAMATPPYPVVVDLSAIRFFGSAGLNELLTHHRDARATGVPLRIVATHKAVLRPITMTGLDEVLELHPDVEHALSADRSVWTAC